MPAKKSAKRSSEKRDQVTPRKGDSRYVKRDSRGQFQESDDVGKSLKRDRASKAKRTVQSGYGDQGDQKKRSAKRYAGTDSRLTTRRSPLHPDKGHGSFR